MKHIRDVTVNLETASGTKVVEAQNPNVPRAGMYGGLVGSRFMAVKAGRQFKIRIILGERFKIYKAQGVKVVVVSLYKGQGPDKLVRRAQAWWVKVNTTNRPIDFTLSCFINEDSLTGPRERLPFIFPQPTADYASAPRDWMLQEAYCANEGCIAVFVERGKLNALSPQVQSKDADTGHKHVDPIPIAFDWFTPLRSDHGFPYVFEFRNMSSHSLDLAQGAGTDTFGYNTDDMYGTESSGSDSAASSGSGDEDLSEVDVVQSDISDEPIPPRKRRLRAARPQQQQRKIQRTDNTSCPRARSKTNSGAGAASSAKTTLVSTCHDEDDDENMASAYNARMKRESELRDEHALRSNVKTKSHNRTNPPVKTPAPRISARQMASSTPAPESAAAREQALRDELRTIEIRMELRQLEKEKNKKKSR